jgi:hypothetical protein
MLYLKDSFVVAQDIHYLKGLSYEVDFENVDENLQILAFIRVTAGF